MEILSLGEKIKQKRKEKNMTLKELAGDKVTPGQISLVESGKSKPSIDLLEYIAEKMDVSLDYILETEKRQAEKLCEYYSKLASASLYSESYEQAREAINKGMIYARDYNLEYFVGLNELFYGKIEYGQGNYKNAQNRLISANEIFLRVGKIRDAVETYVQLGLTSYRLSYYDSALSFFMHAEKLINENVIIDDDIIIKIYYNVSLCYSMLDNHASSIDYVLLALEKLKKKNDSIQYGQSLLMASISYNNLNKYEEALEYAEKAIQVFRELDNLYLVAGIETDIGTLLSNLGNVEDSFKHLENAYRIKSEIKDRTVIETILKLADNYISIDNMDKAKEMVNCAYEKCIEDDAADYFVRIYNYIYNIKMKEQDKTGAELCLLEGSNHLKNLNMISELADLYIMLAEFYRDEGKQEEALKYYSDGIEVYRKLKPQRNTK